MNDNLRRCGEPTIGNVHPAIRGWNRLVDEALEHAIAHPAPAKKAKR